ncbi:MAG: hypothetical protein HQL54_09545 [Magnetococcales bacterium]|nr:hypothetical protein [Magnetococcales bacterium]
MIDARVVDTNVLIVASAADDGSPFQPGATPVEEQSLRKHVLDWLIDFEKDSERHAVMDWDWLICGEYQNKLTEQDFGLLSMMAKHDRGEVVWISLSTDSDGHAVLQESLSTSVTDRADRKMVAAVLAAKREGHPCKLTNACDTDWFDCADVLIEHGVEVEQLIETWLYKKWQAKKNRP